MRHPTVFQFLFRLSADCGRLPADRLLRRLVTGLANHYNASTCSVHKDDSGWPTATADLGEDFVELDALQRARLESIEARLVRETIKSNERTSALDLDGEESLEEWLTDALGVMDIFAFPLRVDMRPRGALVLYLPTDSKPLGDSDLQALMAIGEVLRVAAEARREDAAKGHGTNGASGHDDTMLVAS